MICRFSFPHLAIYLCRAAFTICFITFPLQNAEAGIGTTCVQTCEGHYEDGHAGSEGQAAEDCLDDIDSACDDVDVYCVGTPEVSDAMIQYYKIFGIPIKKVYAVQCVTTMCRMTCQDLVSD